MHFPMRSLQPEGIAIVGIAAELPSGTSSRTNLDYESFFQFLLAEGQAYEKIPSDRFSVDFIHGRGVGKIGTDSGAFLKELELFDHLEFGVSSKDASLMPVGGRKLLETTFLALVDSGIDYRGHNVGCYMSGIAHDTFSVSGSDDSEASKGSFVSGPSVIANRISYYLDLRGPSIPIDTACSSSLVATHMAVQAIRNGECEAAVVGGCQINHRFSDWLTYTGGGILAADGRCKPFDSAADGFGRGEGVVSIVLKPIEAALRDNDKIYGTILGTGVNSTGMQAPVAAPVAAAQMDAMLRAFAQAGRRPKDVDYVELHATGTAQGDPTEANWAGSQFSRDKELLIGSVKGNIGHLEIAAFLASLCKICAMFETGRIPPNVNFKTPNPRIEWKKYNLRVPVREERLRCNVPGGRPLVAMASSGIGGVNAHCVLEAPPVGRCLGSTLWRPSDVQTPILLVAGGLSPRSAAAVGDYLASFKPGDVLSLISQIHGRRSRSMTWRSFAVTLPGSDRSPSFSKPVMVPRVAPTVVFVYSGQGTQHWHMGREMFSSCRIFRDSILQLDEMYKAISGSSLIQNTGLFDATVQVPDSLGSIWPIEITLPALTMLQLALTDTLAAVGIRPDAVIGHSAGETAVLSASGAGSKTLALELSVARGRALSLLEARGGTMAALSCPPPKAKQIIDDVIKELGTTTAILEIGCYNTPDAVTLSGSEEAIYLAVNKANKENIFARRLLTRIPVHSSMMESCHNSYTSSVDSVFAHHPHGPPILETFSTKTGGVLESYMDARYFWESTEGPVLFTDAVQQVLARHSQVTFIEIGPHPVLTGYLSDMARDDDTVVTTLRRPRRNEGSVELRSFMDCLGHLIMAGHNTVDFDVLCKVPDRSSLPRIPAFPLAKRHVPFYNSTFDRTRVSQTRLGPLNYAQIQINAQTHPELADHVIKGEPIMPGSGYIEMALEFGAKRLTDVKYLSVLTLSSERPVPVQVARDGLFWTVKSADPERFADKWPPKYDRLHASGGMCMEWGPENELPPVDIKRLQQRLPAKDMTGFYEDYGTFAQYGPTYRRITSIRIGVDALGRDEFLLQLRGADHDLPELPLYHIHPAILDAAGHILVHPMGSGLLLDDHSGYYLPSGIREVVAHKALFDVTFPSMLHVHIVVTDWHPDAFTTDLSILTEKGQRLVTLHGLEIALHSQSTRIPDRRYDVIWRPLDIRLTSLLTVSNLQSCTHRYPGVADRSSDMAHCPEPVFSVLEPWRRTEMGILVDFRRGHESQLQSLVTSLDPLRKESIWVVARAGIDGDTALGFSRSFKKEYDLWTVGVISYHVTWDNPQLLRDAILELLGLSLDELEIHIDAEGMIHVPRIVERPSASSHSLHPSLPWTIKAQHLQSIPLPTVSQDHILVHVDHVSSYTMENIWFFMGHSEGTPGSVAGVVSGDLSNLAVVHRDGVIELPTECQMAPRCLLASVIVFLAVGAEVLRQASRCRQVTVLVTHGHSALSSSVSRFCSRFDLDVHVKTGAATTDDVTRYHSRRLVVISGSVADEEVHVLQELVAGHGKLFLWNSDFTHLARANPWVLREALEWASQTTTEGSGDIYSMSQIAAGCTIQSPVLPLQVFDPERAYLLVGGVGSIGIRVVLWMYQHGARDITLTSRYGRNTLWSRSEFMPRRILGYLDRLPDLILQIVEADAVCVSDMRLVVDNIQKRRPLAGCMLLAGVILDRSFSAQTQETFDKVINPKVESFQVIETVTSIPTLDFLIAFSSVAALFGNVGQTNYSSANAALAGLTRKYHNAFSIVVPAINDSNFFLAAAASQKQAQYQHFTDWGMSAREFCECIGDALHQAKEARLYEYIPDFDWHQLSKRLGGSSFYDHLIHQSLPEDAVPEHKDKKRALRDIICRILNVPDEDMSRDIPLASYGLDSSSATALSYALRPLFSISQIQLLADQTLLKLEKRLTTDISPPSTDEPLTAARDSDVKPRQTRLMLDLVTKYTSRISAQIAQGRHLERCHPLERVILITGTTGSLGAHVLADLLAGNDVKKIYALVRKSKGAQDALARQRITFLERDLDASLLDSTKLSILEGDVSMDSFGLSDETYTALSSELTHVIHIGWPTAFMLPLTQYEHAIRGLSNIIGCTMSGTHLPAKIVFISSTAAMYSWSDSEPVREEPFTDPAAAATSSGYIESKWVAERILAIAADKGARVTIVRVTQLTAASNGLWKPDEWFPAVVAASAALGFLPDAPGTISWLPVALGARALNEMLDSDKLVLHLHNPRSQPISSLLEILASVLGLKRISYNEWVHRLGTEYVEGTDASMKLQLSHSMKLMDIFEHGSRNRTNDENFGFTRRHEVVQALSVSPTLRSISSDSELSVAVNTLDVESWVQWWRQVGFLPSP